MVYFVLKNNAEILKCFQAIVFEQNTDKSSEKMPKTSIIYQNLLFIVTLWMTCQKHDFAKAGANISKTWSYAWSLLKKIYQELFNIQYYSLESGPITLLERDEECVKKLTFYDKTHATCDRVYINIPKTWEFYILEQISTWSSRLIMKLNSL